MSKHIITPTNPALAPSGLPLQTLGSTIKFHISTAEHAKGKRNEHLLAAGLHLIEARNRVQAGEYESPYFSHFISNYSPMESSRAYELIAIAEGKVTVDQLRLRKAETMQRIRARDKIVRPLDEWSTNAEQSAFGARVTEVRTRLAKQKAGTAAYRKVEAELDLLRSKNVVHHMAEESQPLDSTGNSQLEVIKSKPKMGRPVLDKSTHLLRLINKELKGRSEEELTKWLAAIRNK